MAIVKGRFIELLAPRLIDDWLDWLSLFEDNKMTKDKVSELFNVIDNECHKLRNAGQAEYAGGEDAFGNFNRLAAMTGVSREHVLMIYAIKHLDGIMAYVNGHKSQREDVRGRINDMIVYLKLLRCMVEENDVKQRGTKLNPVNPETDNTAGDTNT